MSGCFPLRHYLLIHIYRTLATRQTFDVHRLTLATPKLYLVSHRPLTTMADDGFFSACPDPELASLLSKLPDAPKIYTDDLPSGRIRFNTVFTEIYRSVQRKQLPSGMCSSTRALRSMLMPSVEGTYVSTDHHIPVDGGSILIRTYRPSAPDSTTFPLFVWTHGGGGYTSISLVLWMSLTGAVWLKDSYLATSRWTTTTCGSSR